MKRSAVRCLGLVLSAPILGLALAGCSGRRNSEPPAAGSRPKMAPSEIRRSGAEEELLKRVAAVTDVFELHLMRKTYAARPSASPQVVHAMDARIRQLADAVPPRPLWQVGDTVELLDFRLRQLSPGRYEVGVFLRMLAPSRDELRVVVYAEPLPTPASGKPPRGWLGYWELTAFPVSPRWQRGDPIVLVREVSGPECPAFRVGLEFSKRYSPAAAFALLGRRIDLGEIRFFMGKTAETVSPKDDSG